MVHVNNYSSGTIYIGQTIKCIPLKTENKMGEEESECFSISILNGRFTVKKKKSQKHERYEFSFKK